VILRDCESLVGLVALTFLRLQVFLFRSTSLQNKRRDHLLVVFFCECESRPSCPFLSEVLRSTLIATPESSEYDFGSIVLLVGLIITNGVTSL
jgi:hypothetical protein